MWQRVVSTLHRTASQNQASPMRRVAGPPASPLHVACNKRCNMQHVPDRRPTTIPAAGRSGSWSDPAGQQRWDLVLDSGRVSPKQHPRD